MPYAHILFQKTAERGGTENLFHTKPRHWLRKKLLYP